MLTGDSKKVADAVGKQIGVDVVKSELLPADKVLRSKSFLMKKRRMKYLPLLEMESMMRRCWLEQMSEPRWEVERMLRLKRQM